MTPDPSPMTVSDPKNAFDTVAKGRPPESLWRTLATPARHRPEGRRFAERARAQAPLEPLGPRSFNSPEIRRSPTRRFARVTAPATRCLFQACQLAPKNKPTELGLRATQGCAYDRCLFSISPKEEREEPTALADLVKALDRCLTSPSSEDERAAPHRSVPAPSPRSNRKIEPQAKHQKHELPSRIVHHRCQLFTAPRSRKKTDE